MATATLYTDFNTLGWRFIAALLVPGLTRMRVEGLAFGASFTSVQVCTLGGDRASISCTANGPADPELIRNDLESGP
jgi:hypothetical protein